MRRSEGGGYRAPDSTALAEDQDQETAEGHSQAPDPCSRPATSPSHKPDLSVLFVRLA